jgi:lysophospholipase L1-like esterase
LRRGRRALPIAGLRWLVGIAIVAAAMSLTVNAQDRTDFASVRPTMRVDYWQKRQAEITDHLRDTKDLSPIRLVFLGDSITDFWLLGDNPWEKGKKCGRAIWDESFGGSAPENVALNLGISGDRIEHALYRLQPRSSGGRGELDRPDLDPDFVMILIGINNTWDAEDPVVASVYEGIRAVVVAAHERKPRATLVVQSLLPTSDDAKNKTIVEPVNRRLSELARRSEFSGFVAYLDLYQAFVDAGGRQVAAYFNDGLHPSESGYRRWRDQLVPFLARARTGRIRGVSDRAGEACRPGAALPKTRQGATEARARAPTCMGKT